MAKSINRLISQYLQSKNTNIDLQSLEDHKPKPFISGLYFLFNDDTLVYIGVSKNIKLRIMVHQHEDIKPYTSYRFIEMPIKEARVMEPILIKKFLPWYNKEVETINYINNLNRIQEELGQELEFETKYLPVNQ